LVEGLQSSAAMTQSRRCWEESARSASGFGERQTILPPPPEVALPDPYAPRDLFTWIPGISFAEVDEDATPTLELSCPTDVDGTQWWTEDEEETAITLRPPCFH
jgi:hypothetical protein